MLVVLEQSFGLQQGGEYLNALSVFLYSIFKFFSNVQLSSEFYQGGVGYIVAAVMQTKGLIDQSKILANFGELKEIAALFYLFGLGMAFGAIAVFGNYKQGAYFLIGPVLFTFATTATVESDGVHAKIGNYTTPNDIAQEKSFLEQIRAVGPDDGPANISLLFATIDEITTEVIQAVTAVFLDAKNREHLKYVGRENALAYAMLGIEDSTGLTDLLIGGFKANCHSVFTRSLQIGAEHQTKVPVRETKPEEIEKVRAEQDRLLTELTFPLNFKMKEYLNSNRGQEGFKDVPEFKVSDPVVITCANAWKWVGAGFQALAKERLKPESFEGLTKDESDFPWDKIYPDIKEFLEKEKGNGTAPEVLAAYILKNTMALTSHSMLESQIFNNSPMNATQSKLFIGDIGEVERHGGYMYLKYFAGSIPYLQGLLLYLLSIAYPFFAILLVMPSKATSFLVWFSLWVWVKSWDLGFAMVYVVRDIYWDMLKHRVNGFDEVIDWKDPGSIFALIMHNDPLASQNTYWMIMSFLTVSIPFLTAQFCFGASNMFDMFRMGIDKTAGRFRNFEQQRGRRHMANPIEQSLRDRPQQVATALARDALKMNSASSENPLGLQSAFGESYGSDKKSDSTDFSGLLGGAQFRKVGSVRMLGLGMANVMTPELAELMRSTSATIASFETESNKNAPAGAKSYPLPKEFASAVGSSGSVQGALNSPVDVATQKAIKDREDGSILRDGKTQDNKGKEGLSWGDFIDERADARGEKVVIPDITRGMPGLDSAVSKEALESLYGANDPMRDGKKHSWGEVFEREAGDQQERFAALSAVLGRRYAPAMQTGANQFFAAAQSEVASSVMYGGAIDGSSSAYLPGVKSQVDNLIGGWEGVNELAGSLWKVQGDIKLPSAATGRAAGDVETPGGSEVK